MATLLPVWLSIPIPIIATAYSTYTVAVAVVNRSDRQHKADHDDDQRPHARFHPNRKTGEDGRRRTGIGRFDNILDRGLLVEVK